MQEVSNDLNSEGALVQVVNGLFQYSKSSITRVSMNTTIGVAPIISLQNSDLTLNQSLIEEFSGRLLNAFQGSKVVVLSTKISQNLFRNTRSSSNLIQHLSTTDSLSQFRFQLISQLNEGVFDVKSSSLEIRDSQMR